MRMHLCRFLAIPALIFCLAARPAAAQTSEGNPRDKEEIAKNAERFVAAFHKGDAKALAAFWDADGHYTEQTGRQIKGRDAIEKLFQGMFSENKGLKMRIDSDTLRFVTPDVAIEEGTTGVIHANGGPPSRTRYTIVHVKKDGKWLLSSVRDAAYTPSSNHEHLRGLAWAVGTWLSDPSKGDHDRLSFTWAEHRNFLISSFSSNFKNIKVASATQWIGWDPAAKSIRSWIFDGNGGFGEGAWTKDGNKWIIKTHSLFPDGTKLTATYTLTPGPDATLTLDVTGRTVDGNALPDRKEIKLKRVN